MRKSIKVVAVLLLATVLAIILCQSVIIVSLYSSMNGWRLNLFNYLDNSLSDYQITMDNKDRIHWFAPFNMVYAKSNIGFYMPKEEFEIEPLLDKAGQAARQADTKFPGKYKTDFEIFISEHSENVFFLEIRFERRCESVFSMT